MTTPRDYSNSDNSARPPSATFTPPPSEFNTVGFMKPGATGWDRCSVEDKEDWDLMRRIRRKYKLPSPRPTSFLEHGGRLQEVDEITFRATGHDVEEDRQLPAGSPTPQFIPGSEDIFAMTPPPPERATTSMGQGPQEESSQELQQHEVQSADDTSHFHMVTTSLAGIDSASSGAAAHTAITERTGRVVGSASDVPSLAAVAVGLNCPNPTTTRMCSSIEEEMLPDNSPTKPSGSDHRMNDVQNSMDASTTSQNHSFKQVAPSDGVPRHITRSLGQGTPGSTSTTLAGNPIQPSRFSAYLPVSPPPGYLSQTQAFEYPIIPNHYSPGITNQSGSASRLPIAETNQIGRKSPQVVISRPSHSTSPGHGRTHHRESK